MSQVPGLADSDDRPPRKWRKPCVYCKDALGGLEPDGMEVHAMCNYEEMDREDRGMCVKCGTEPALRDGGLVCESCVSEDAPYLGYPPGGNHAGAA